MSRLNKSRSPEVEDIYFRAPKSLQPKTDPTPRSITQQPKVTRKPSLTPTPVSGPAGFQNGPWLWKDHLRQWPGLRNDTPSSWPSAVMFSITPGMLKGIICWAVKRHLWVRRFVPLHGMPPLRASGIGRRYLKRLGVGILKRIGRRDLGFIGKRCCGGRRR
jgi:hypothetical protein